MNDRIKERCNGKKMRRASPGASIIQHESSADRQPEVSLSSVRYKIDIGSVVCRPAGMDCRLRCYDGLWGMNLTFRKILCTFLQCICPPI